jgi:hypothetical protein
MSDTPITDAFADILNRQSREIEKLPPLPVGEFQTTVVGHEYKKVGAKNTPAVIFTLQGFAPMSQISHDELAKCGDLRTRELRYTLYLTDAAGWRVRQFLDHCGVEEGDRSLAERIDGAINRQVLVTIGHDIGKGPNAGVFFANVVDTRPV